MKGPRHRDAVDRYLSRLRRRAFAVHAVRTLVLAGGLGGLAFGLSAAAVGPVSSPIASSVAWGAIGLVVLAAALLGLKPAFGLRGVRAARLLGRRDPALGSATRSAVELATDPLATKMAPELVRAHRDQVRAALVQIPPRRVVPWSAARHPTVVMGLLGALAAAALVFGMDRAASGAYAMLHPGVHSDEGLPVAAVVAETQARLVFPSHIGRAPVVLHDADLIEAPRGTTVHYTVRPRIDAREASLEVVDRNVRLAPDGHGRFRGRFVVRQGGALRIRVHQTGSGRWLEDPIHRSIRAIRDRAPSVALTAPDANATIDLDTAVPVAWNATDDIGLRRVDLVVRMPDGQDVRRNLSRIAAGVHQRQADGRSTITASELGARPGDQLELWVEARDGNVVDRPNVGESIHRTLTIASEATRRLQRVADLQQTLGLGLDALADRLATNVPNEPDAQHERLGSVQTSGRAFVDGLRGLAEQMPSGQGRPGGPEDGSLYQAMAQRVRRGLVREARAHTRRAAPHALRARLDARLVEELEKDDLLLSDLLGRARLEDAAAIAHDLEALRREMASLVAELRRTNSPQAERALRAAIARAQARMRDLMDRIGAMGQDVPSDFINANALARAQKMNALDAMQKALDKGDIDAIERQLGELEHQIGSVAEALGSAEVQYAQSRFGPREKAMADAMDALAGLEAEQRELARHSDDVRRKAADAALQASSASDKQHLHALAEQARQTRKGLSDVPDEALGALDEDAMARAKQRLTDSADALDNGDLGEARRMARQAVDDLDGLARDLQLSALMFGRSDAHATAGARAARQAARQARQLRDGIEQAIPHLADFLGDDARKQMHSDAERQDAAAQSAEGLAERFDQGPDGQPLSPEAADSMQEIHRTMQQALDHLQREDPVRAAQDQEEAARRLAQLRDRLDKSRRSSGGGGQGDEGGGQRQDGFRQRVHIPGPDEHQGPMALRRKLLDAMREGAPSDYAESVRKYYQELLR